MWKEHVEQLRSDSDIRATWGMIHALDDKSQLLQQNAILTHEGASYRTDAAKADLFAREYAAVSRIQLSREERMADRRTARLVRAPYVRDSRCSEFSPSEHEASISHLRSGGAPGSDDIKTEFLKHFGPRATNAILSLLNRSWSTGSVPQA